MPDDIQSRAGYSTIPVPAVLKQLEKASWRDAFVSDSVRARIAMLIRALREQREWSQADLGSAMGKPQSNISKFEDPDYGKYSLTTLFEFAAAYGLPLYIDMPEWDVWFRLMANQSQRALQRKSFDSQSLATLREQEIAARRLEEIWAITPPGESLGARLQAINTAHQQVAPSPLMSDPLSGRPPPADKRALAPAGELPNSELGKKQEIVPLAPLPELARKRQHG